MKYLKALVSATIFSTVLSLATKAQGATCSAYTPREDGPALQLTTYKRDVGRSAFLTLWGMEWRDAGMTIGRAYDFFGNCTFPGIGVGRGSGSGEMSNGEYPDDANVTFWIYGGGVSLGAARTAIYSEISAVAPTTTTTTAVTTTTTVAPATTVAVAVTTTTTTIAVLATKIAVVPSTTTSTTTPAVAAITTTQTVTPDDGEIIDDYVNLTVQKYGFGYLIQITSSLEEQSIRVQARLTPRRSIIWNVRTDANGFRRLSTSRNLAGLVVSAWVDGQKYDTVTVGG